MNGYFTLAASMHAIFCDLSFHAKCATVIPGQLTAERIGVMMEAVLFLSIAYWLKLPTLTTQ